MHSGRYKQIKHFVESGKVKVTRVGSGYAHNRYRVDKNEANLSDEDLAIICDNGNLPFGFRREGNIICVYID